MIMDNFSDTQRTKKEFYRKVLIGDIRPDDNQIQIVGIALNINASQEFELSDNTGKVQVREIPDQCDKIIEKNTYRVFGRYLIDPLGTHYLAADIIQDLKTLNLERYIQTLELMKKIS